jgi:hypothetical protein
MIVLAKYCTQVEASSTLFQSASDLARDTVRFIFTTVRHLETDSENHLQNIYLLTYIHTHVQIPILYSAVEKKKTCFETSNIKDLEKQTCIQQNVGSKKALEHEPLFRFFTVRQQC